MIRSLRAQLALWHGGLLALTLILLASVTYLVLRQVLSSLADAALQDYADKTARNIALAVSQAEFLDPRKSLTHEERTALERAAVSHYQDTASSWGRFVQVDDAITGESLYVADALRQQRFLDDAETRDRIRRHLDRVVFKTVTDPFPYPMRIVSVPVEIGARIPFLVRVGAPVEGVDEAISRVSTLLLVLTPSIFVIALAGGWILVGRSLKPVDEMTRAALSIESKRMDVRLVPPRTDDEIGRLASALNEMIARLDRSFRQAERFSADASHELKTPLTTIRGEAEVALMGDMDPSRTRATLNSIVEETERLSEIVNNLLLLSRADADQVRLKNEMLLLDQVIMQAYEPMERLAHRKNISLDIGAMDEVTLAGDSLWLHQLITNLIHNAINYTPEGGKVTLSLTQDSAESGAAAHEGSGTAAAAPAEDAPRTEAGRAMPAFTSREGLLSDDVHSQTGDPLEEESGGAQLDTPAPDAVAPPRTRFPFATRLRARSAGQPQSPAASEAAQLTAVFRVRDTGPGIPAEHLPHIFDRFYRVDMGRSRDQGGSGLGLNIARWVAESHGGSLTVESVPGEGSTFTVRLPIVAVAPTAAPN